MKQLLEVRSRENPNQLLGFLPADPNQSDVRFAMSTLRVYNPNELTWHDSTVYQAVVLPIRPFQIDQGEPYPVIDATQLKLDQLKTIPEFVQID